MESTLFPPLPREIPWIVRIYAKVERFFWGRLLREVGDPPTIPDVLARRMSRDLAGDPNEIPFQIAICHLHRQWLDSDKWGRSEAVRDLFDVLNEPHLVRDTRLTWFWRLPSGCPMASFFDGMVRHCLTDGHRQIWIEYGLPCSEIWFGERTGSAVATLPSALCDPFRIHIQFFQRLQNPMLLPGSIALLAQHGLRPELVTGEAERQVIRFVEDPGWLDRFGLTVEEIHQRVGRGIGHEDKEEPGTETPRPNNT